MLYLLRILVLFTLGQAVLPAALSHLNSFYILSPEELTITILYYACSLMITVWALYSIKQHENGYLPIWTGLPVALITVFAGGIIYHFYWQYLYPKETPGETTVQLLKKGSIIGISNITSCVIASLLMMTNHRKLRKKLKNDEVLDVGFLEDSKEFDDLA